MVSVNKLGIKVHLIELIFFSPNETGTPVVELALIVLYRHVCISSTVNISASTCVN